MHTTQTFDRAPFASRVAPRQIARTRLLILLAAAISFVLSVCLWYALMSAALAPLIWAAIQDGRYNDEQQEQYREEVLRPAAATAHKPGGAAHGA